MKLSEFLRACRTFESVDGLAGPHVDAAMELFRKVNGFTGSIADWERPRSKAEILAAYDKAIAFATAQEQAT